MSIGFACVHKHPILKAKTRIPVSTNYGRLLRLTKRFSGVVEADLFTGLRTFKKRVTADALYNAWKKGDYQDVMRTIPWNDLPKDIEPAAKKLRSAAFEAGAFTLQALPPNINSNLRWDMSNPRLERYTQTKTGNLIVGVREDTLKIVRDAVVRSFNQALTPREVGNMLHGSIGLFPKWERAVENYRSSLVADERPEAQVEKLTEAYRNRLLKARARMIARTETRRASNFGQLSVWREASSKGLINRSTAKKVWIVDGNPCDICEPMDGEAVGLDESWSLNNGDIVDNPSDSHPNCLCGMELDFG